MGHLTKIEALPYDDTLYSHINTLPPSSRPKPAMC